MTKFNEVMFSLESDKEAVIEVFESVAIEYKEKFSFIKSESVPLHAIQEHQD